MIPASFRCLLRSNLVTAEVPFFDMSGSVVGVVVAQLSVLQNVNFAISILAV
jgi:hypothetical protein